MLKALPAVQLAGGTSHLLCKLRGGSCQELHLLRIKNLLQAFVASANDKQNLPDNTQMSWSQGKAIKDDSFLFPFSWLCLWKGEPASLSPISSPWHLFINGAEQAPMGCTLVLKF